LLLDTGKKAICAARKKKEKIKEDCKYEQGKKTA